MNEQLAIDVMSSEQQTSHQDQFVMELLDLHGGVWNNPQLSELVRSYYVDSLKTRDFCATLQAHLDAHEYEESAHEFLDELSRVYDQQRLMQETLQSFDNRFVEELDRIGYWKKLSAASFTAAAAISAAVASANANPRRPGVAAAAAAASVLFGALGKWIDSLLKKRESSVKKDKEIIGVMILGAKTSVKGLTNIDVLARSWLQLEKESMLSETVDDGKKVAAVMKELQGDAEDYGRDMNSINGLVLHTIFKHKYFYNYHE